MLARGATSWGPFSLLGSCILPTPVQFFFSDAFVASISPCRNISASSGAAVREPRFAFCTWHISNVLSECVCAPVPMTRFAFWFSTLAVIHLREVLHCRIGYGSACVPVAIRVPASAHMICRAAGIQAASRTGQSREGRSGRGPTSGNRRQYSPMRQLSFFLSHPVCPFPTRADFALRAFPLATLRSPCWGFYSTAFLRFQRLYLWQAVLFRGITGELRRL